MKLQRIIAVSAIVFTLFLLQYSSALAKRPPSKSTPVAVATAQAASPCAGDLDSCPDQGCGEFADFELNRAKNRKDNPDPQSIQPMTLSSIKQINQPKRWNTGDNRAPITGDGKEGTPVIVTSILKRVKQEGAESCNCNLDVEDVTTDLHLVLVSVKTDAEEKSVTAEITPRMRKASHPNWVFPNVKPLEGKFIRLTGWLMLDTKHIPQSHRQPNERRNQPLKRATNWEVHPIIKFEVCTQTVAMCRTGVGWKEF